MRQSRRDSPSLQQAKTAEEDTLSSTLHALFNLETRTIEAFIDKLENIECLVADLGYLFAENSQLTAEKRGISYIRPKKNSLTKAKGCWIWKNMVTSTATSANGKPTYAQFYRDSHTKPQLKHLSSFFTHKTNPSLKINLIIILRQKL